jgi:NADH-quinone oxidoreductase subunit D
MSELLLEHRYAKIMKEKLNEDGRTFHIEFRSYSPTTHGIFKNVLLMDGERILEAEPTIGYIRAFEKLENRPFTK